MSDDLVKRLREIGGTRLKSVPTQREVDEACMNYDHSFGLMSIADANKLRFSAREWLRTWQKVQDHGSPDETKRLGMSRAFWEGFKDGYVKAFVFGVSFGLGFAVGLFVGEMM